MKIGLNQEYCIFLTPPSYSVTTAAGTNQFTALGAVNHYLSGLFIPHYDMQVNRIALCVATTGSQVIRTGMTTNSSGLPNGSGGALTFINSGTTSTFTNNDFTQVTFTDTTLSAGTKYFMAAQTTTFTSTVNLYRTFNNASYGFVPEFPYVADNTSGGVVKRPGLPRLCIGYNNGTFTQWYGEPVSLYGQTQALNTSGTAVASCGCKFNLPYEFYYYKVKAVVVHIAKSGVHSLTLQIYQSDNSTQVTNASSTINSNWYTATGQGLVSFDFGNPVILNSKTNYYIRISAAGTAATGTNVYYTIIAGTALTTANATNAEFMNAYDCVNNFSTTSTGAVYTEYDNARLNCYLVCETFASSYRGTKENGYSGF